jgi:hypothetical protein
VAKIVERFTAEGPWQNLGDGETFEDALFTALTSHGADRCRTCGELLTVREEDLGQLTQEVLASW